MQILFVNFSIKALFTTFSQRNIKWFIEIKNMANQSSIYRHLTESDLIGYRLAIDEIKLSQTIKSKIYSVVENKPVNHEEFINNRAQISELLKQLKPLRG